jgi:hypothetical protein
MAIDLKKSVAPAAPAAAPAPAPVQSAATPAPEAEAPPAPKTMLLALTGAQRFVSVADGGALFVALDKQNQVIAYEFEIERAQRMLEQEVDGRKVFSVFKPKKAAPAPRNPDEPVPAPAPRSKIPAAAPVISHGGDLSTADLNPAPKAAAPGISLTTAEEEAEAGLPPIDETPTTI